MKKTLIVLLLALLSCQKDEPIIIYGNQPCSEVSNPTETLEIGIFKFKLISLISTTGMASLELVDLNGNSISNSTDLSYQWVQLQNGNNCWETSYIKKAIGSSDDTFSGIYYNVPKWAIDPNTKVFIKVSIAGNSYFIVDNNITKSKITVFPI